MRKIMMAAVVLGALAGCATLQLPAERWGRLDATMQQAQHLGADEIPAARLHLKLASDEGAAAKQLALDGDARATLVLARAQADAVLSVSLAHEAAVRRSMERAAATLESNQNPLESQGAP